MRFHLFPAFVFSLHLNLIGPVIPTSVSFENGAYSNIVFAISPDVPITWAEAIMDNVQCVIRRASSVLYQASLKRAYFKDVRILVPESWSNFSANFSTWEIYSAADVRVAPGGLTQDEIPYTLQSGGCKKPGEYIHLSPDYLRNLANCSNSSAQFGLTEKIFVREWARLRYGVFNDEDGCQRGKGSNTHSDWNSNSWRASNRCASLMSSELSFDNKAEAFCDKIEPIHFLPSKHSAMCGLDTVWEVITSHQDFAEHKNLTNNYGVIVEPSFQIVRSSRARIIIVADTIITKEKYDRANRLRHAILRWIKYDIREGSALSVVQLSTFNKHEVTVLSNIDADRNRNDLIYRLSNMSNSAPRDSCNACGLRTAFQVLKSGGQGGIIIMIASESQPSIDNYISNDIVQSNIRFVSIALGQKVNDVVENLAVKTKGRTYFIKDDDFSQGLNDALIDALIYTPTLPSHQIAVVIFKRQFQNGSGKISSYLTIDDSIGHNFKFRIDYTKKSYLKSFKLISPSGVVYSQLQYDDATNTATLEQVQVDKGKWYFSLTVTNTTADSLAVRVTSQAKSKSRPPITVQCYLPDGRADFDANVNPVRILAKVMQGSNPVIRAKVKAYVYAPNGSEEIVDLFDNGASADTSVDDGIYSRYFIRATSMGRYSVECEAWDNDGSAVSTYDSKSTGEFHRMEMGGSFMITKPTFKVSYYYEPSRINDLLVVDVRTISFNQQIITIQFTAPGEERDWGTVSRYEIRYSTVFSHISSANFNSWTIVLPEHVVDDGSLQPLKSGSKQTITFLLKNDNQSETYFVAVKSRNEYRNSKWSKLSNIALAYFPSCPAVCIHQYPGVCWNETSFNTTARMKCPNNSTGTSTWTCGLNGQWLTSIPSVSNCTNPLIEEAISVAYNKILNAANPSSALVDLRREIEKTELASGNLKQLDETIQLAISKQKTIILESDNSSIIIKNFTDSVIQLNDLVLGSDKAFFGLSSMERRQVIDGVQKNVDETVRLLADNLSDETFEKEAKNLVVILDEPSQDYSNDYYTLVTKDQDQLIIQPGMFDAVSGTANNRFYVVSYTSFQKLLYGDLLEKWEQNIEQGIPQDPLMQIVVTNVVGLISILDHQPNYNDTVDFTTVSAVDVTDIAASIGLEPSNKTNVTSKIVFNMDGKYRVNKSSANCVTWDYATQDWFNKGCQVMSSNDDSITCQCHRLANVAVLMDIHGLFTEQTSHVLESITLIGKSISIFCQVLALLIFCALREWRQKQQSLFQIHINLCLNLVTADILFLSGVRATSNLELCLSIAVFLHYLYLCAFGWMLVKGLHIYFSVTTVFELRGLKRWHYYVIGYGMPLLVVVITLTVVSLTNNIYIYKRSSYCWLNNANGLIWAFTGPVALIILLNIVFLSKAILKSLKLKGDNNLSSNSHLNSMETKWKKAFQRIFGVISLNFVLGITWISGFLYWDESTLVFSYVFAIFNSLQGVIIFVSTYFLFQKHVISKELRRQHASNPNIWVEHRRRKIAKDKLENFPIVWTQNTNNSVATNEITEDQFNNLENSVSENNQSRNQFSEESGGLISYNSIVNIEITPETCQEHLWTEELNRNNSITSSEWTEEEQSDESPRNYSMTQREENVEAEDAITHTSSFRNSIKGTLTRVYRHASISRAVQRSGSLLERQYNRITTIVNWFENNMLR